MKELMLTGHPEKARVARGMHLTQLTDRCAITVEMRAFDVCEVAVNVWPTPFGVVPGLVADMAASIFWTTSVLSISW